MTLATKIIDKRANGTKRVSQTFGENSRVEQSHKDKTNINSIMRKYIRQGTVPISGKIPIFGDFTGNTDFHTTQNKIVEAKEKFMKVPSEIRKKFNNDVGEFIEFANNPENQQELENMGLLPKAVPQQEIKPPESPQELEKAPEEVVKTEV